MSKTLIALISAPLIAFVPASFHATKAENPSKRVRAIAKPKPKAPRARPARAVARIVRSASVRWQARRAKVRSQQPYQVETPRHGGAMVLFE